MEETAGEFEVGICDGAGGVVIGDQAGRDVVRPLEAPDDWDTGGKTGTGGEIVSGEPDAAGASTGGVVVTLSGGRQWDKFGNAGRPGRDVLSHPPKVLEGLVDTA